MEIVIFDHKEEATEEAAQRVNSLVAQKPDAVLGLATGSTPLALYRALIERHRASQISFKDITSFNLDEYLGVAPTSPISYRRYMNDLLFDHVDIEPANTHVPDGMTENPQGYGEIYEALIEKAGGIDLQILGIGSNGHIGFNEPTSSLASRTRVKTLSQSTIRDNEKLLEPGMFQPQLCLTMGIGTILDTRQVILLAFGEHKADALRQMVEGPVSAICPASALQMHPRVSVIIDQAAASKLKLSGYYQRVHQESRNLAQS